MVCIEEIQGVVEVAGAQALGRGGVREVRTFLRFYGFTDIDGTPFFLLLFTFFLLLLLLPLAQIA